MCRRNFTMWIIINVTVEAITTYANSQLIVKLLLSRTQTRADHVDKTICFAVSKTRIQHLTDDISRIAGESTARAITIRDRGILRWIINEKHERTRRISRYKVRKYIFQWESGRFAPRHGKKMREWLKSRIDQLIPWGKLKFRLPTPSPIHCKWCIPAVYARLHTYAIYVASFAAVCCGKQYNFLAN